MDIHKDIHTNIHMSMNNYKSFIWTALTRASTIISSLTWARPSSAPACHHYFLYLLWQKWLCFSQVLIRKSTGNNVSSQCVIIISFHLVSLLSTFLIKHCRPFPLFLDSAISLFWRFLDPETAPFMQLLYCQYHFFILLLVECYSWTRRPNSNKEIYHENIFSIDLLWRE